MLFILPKFFRNEIRLLKEKGDSLQFRCTLPGGFYRLYHRGPECPRFQSGNAGNRRAAGGTDHVFQFAGTFAGFHYHRRRAKDGLGGIQQSPVAGQTGEDAAIGKGLNEQVRESGAGTGKAGNGVKVALVYAVNGAALEFQAKKVVLTGFLRPELAFKFHQIP